MIELHLITNGMMWEIFQSFRKMGLRPFSYELNLNPCNKSATTTTTKNSFSLSGIIFFDILFLFFFSSRYARITSVRRRILLPSSGWGSTRTSASIVRHRTLLPLISTSRLRRINRFFVKRIKWKQKKTNPACFSLLIQGGRSLCFVSFLFFFFLFFFSPFTNHTTKGNRFCLFLLFLLLLKIGNVKLHNVIRLRNFNYSRIGICATIPRRS